MLVLWRLGMESEPLTALPVSYTHLRAHETDSYLVCRLLLEKKIRDGIDNIDMWRLGFSTDTYYVGMHVLA